VSVQLTQRLTKLAKGGLTSSLADRAPFFPRKDVRDVIILSDKNALYRCNIRANTVGALLV
jgi:hypothetical protein